jgi:hypothetical protein
MPDVFISYSRKDSDFVHKLHDALTKLNREIWVDWADILLTADWWNEICTGIETAHTFMFVISPDSIASPICNLEIDYAVQNNKRLVPVVRTETDEKLAFEVLAIRELDENTRTTLAGRDMLTIATENWKVLTRHNWLLFSDEVDFDDSFRRLIDAIDIDLEHVKLHTRLLVQAHEWDNHARNNSFLLTGDALREAEIWLVNSSKKTQQPTELQLNFIMSSHQKGRQRQRMMMIGVTIALGITIGLAGLSMTMFGEAVKNLNNSNATEHVLETQMADIIATHTAYVLEADQNLLISTPKATNP